MVTPLRCAGGRSPAPGTGGSGGVRGLVVAHAEAGRAPVAVPAAAPTVRTGLPGRPERLLLLAQVGDERLVEQHVRAAGAAHPGQRLVDGPALLDHREPGDQTGAVHPRLAADQHGAPGAQRGDRGVGEPMHVGVVGRVEVAVDHGVGVVLNALVGAVPVAAVEGDHHVELVGNPGVAACGLVVVAAEEQAGGDLVPGPVAERDVLDLAASGALGAVGLLLPIPLAHRAQQVRAVGVVCDQGPVGQGHGVDPQMRQVVLGLPGAGGVQVERGGQRQVGLGARVGCEPAAGPGTGTPGWGAGLAGHQIASS